MAFILFNHYQKNGQKRLETSKIKIPEKDIFPNTGIGFYLMADDLSFKLHSENDLPALFVVSPTGDTWTDWYQNGKRHRDNDLPSSINFVKEGCYFSHSWYQNGKLHRENDLPAYVHSKGHKAWYKNGKRHRDNDLPATIDPDGSQFWYQNGELHRENDKPAMVFPDGRQQYDIFH